MLRSRQHPSHRGAGRAQLSPTWRMRGFQAPEQDEPVGIEFQGLERTRKNAHEHRDQSWMKAHWHGPLHLRELAGHPEALKPRSLRDNCHAPTITGQASPLWRMRISRRRIAGGPGRVARHCGAIVGRRSLGRPHPRPPRVCRSSGTGQSRRHLISSRAATSQGPDSRTRHGSSPSLELPRTPLRWTTSRPRDRC